MREDLSLDALSRRVVIRGTLRALSGIRVGGAKDVGGLGADLPVLRDARLLPYIPGSSFKGVLRSTVESLLRAAANTDINWSAGHEPPSLWSCNPLVDDKGMEPRSVQTSCMSDKWKKKLLAKSAKGDEELPIEEVLRNSCTVCRVFGNNEIAGRVLIADMPLTNEQDLPQPVEVRDGVAIDRDLLTARDGAKYDYEVVPAGAEFSFEIVLDNTTEAQDGVVVAGLNSIKEGFARIGGFGSRGLGRVTIDGITCEQTDARAILRGEEPRKIEWSDFEKAGREAVSEALGGN